MPGRSFRGPSSWGGGGGGAPTDAPYVTTAANGSLSNETLIGAIILPPDTLANRPAAGSTVAGSLYFPTDESSIYRSTGAAWVLIGTYLTLDAASIDLPSGALAQTFPHRSISSSNNSDLLSGRLSLVAVHLRAGQTVTSISFMAASTALSGGTNQWFALYDSARNKLAVTSDDTSNAWSGNTLKTLNLTSPYAVTTSGLYYLGVCVVASTVPTLRGPVSITAITGLAPILTGSSTTGLTDPASAPATAAAITATTSTPYAFCS